MPKLFSVTLDNKPGELARLAGALAEKGINLRTAAATTQGAKGIVNLITSDDGKTRDTLKTQRFTFTEDEALVARLEDKPGALAQLAKNLAAARVNITSVALLSSVPPKVEVSLTVDNVEKAKTIIK
jgi:hypothetical protein